MKETIKDKKEWVEAARIALAVPGEKAFWDEVKERMEIREKALVEPRNLRD